MLGTPFYNASTRKVIAVFGNLFNDVHVLRKDAGGTVQNDIKVPLAYGPQNSWYAKLRKDYSANDPAIQLTLPRMTFEMNTLQYDAARKVSTFRRHLAPVVGDADSKRIMRAEVPFNMGVDLSIAAKNMEDMLTVVEQIVVFFQPDFNVPIIFDSDFGITKDVSFVLDSVTPDDNYEEGFSDNRLITWTLSFTAKSWILSPDTQGAMIKKVINKLSVNIDENGDYVWAEDITTEVDPITAAEEDAWTVKQTITGLE